MIKSIIISILISLALIGCAPHGHAYKLISNPNYDTTGLSKTDVRIACQITDKTFLVSAEEIDSIVICSKTLKEEKCVDLKMPDSVMKSPYYAFTISDRKFHKLFNADTLELRMKKASEWIKLYYVAVPDSYSE